MYVFNNLKHTNYTSIDEELDGWSFRDRAQYTLDLGAEGVWGDCAVYEYKYAGPGSNYHPANDVQAVFVGELTITREQYELTVKKVDSTNPARAFPVLDSSSSPPMAPTPRRLSPGAMEPIRCRLWMQALIP